MIIKHLYIERRMIPLNIYLQEALDRAPATAAAACEHRACVEYGNAIKDLVAANIFPGDMLWKNFGVTRNGKVVFYDYDEIEYLTDCNFRKMPQPRNEEDEMSGEVWYPVGQHDVFPETVRALPAGQPGGARGVPEAPRRPARRAPSGRRTRSASWPATSTTCSRTRSDMRFVHADRQPPPARTPRRQPHLYEGNTMADPSSSSAPPAPPWAPSRATFPSLSAHDLGGAAIKAAVERAGVVRPTPSAKCCSATA